MNVDESVLREAADASMSLFLDDCEVAIAEVQQEINRLQLACWRLRDGTTPAPRLLVSELLTQHWTEADDVDFLTRGV